MTRISLFRVNSGLESLPCKIHSCSVMKISNRFHQEVLTIITFFSCFCKGWPNFFKFQFIHVHPYHPLQETTGKVFDNKTEPLF